MLFLIWPEFESFPWIKENFKTDYRSDILKINAQINLTAFSKIQYWKICKPILLYRQSSFPTLGSCLQQHARTHSHTCLHFEIDDMFTSCAWRIPRFNGLIELVGGSHFSCINSSGLLQRAVLRWFLLKVWLWVSWCSENPVIDFKFHRDLSHELWPLKNTHYLGLVS